MTLDGFYRHMDVEQCLWFMAWQMGKLGIKTDDLPPYQRDILRDLRRPLDEEALAEMLDYWSYDHERLINRGRDGVSRELPAKPQIDIVVEITKKDNFKAEWFPTGTNYWGFVGPDGSDFRFFHRRESRGSGYHGRPSNELFFIHDVRQAIWWALDRESGNPVHLFAHVLLAACAQVVTLLKQRLEPHFEINMLSDVFVEWEEEEDRYAWQGSSKVAKWYIDDPARRQVEAEQQELAEIEERIGFSEAAFLAAYGKALGGTERGSDQAPNDYVLSERMTRDLKKAGFAAATRKKVERVLYLVDRHRKPGNVVPLRSHYLLSDDGD